MSIENAAALPEEGTSNCQRLVQYLENRPQLPPRFGGSSSGVSCCTASDLTELMDQRLTEAVLLQEHSRLAARQYRPKLSKKIAL